MWTTDEKTKLQCCTVADGDMKTHLSKGDLTGEIIENVVVNATAFYTTYIGDQTTYEYIYINK